MNGPYHHERRQKFEEPGKDGAWFRVQGLGFRVQGLRVRVEGLGSGFMVYA